jgi:putative ABC transport system ATP-binding protein
VPMTDPSVSSGAATSDAARCNDVVKFYRTATSVVRALERVDLGVPRRSIVAVFGPSGSGKSSLARILAAIDLPDGGNVVIDGLEVTELGSRERRRLRRSSIGFLFADPGHNLLPYLDAIEHVELALRMRGVDVKKNGYTDRSGERRSTTEVLELLGLGHRVHHRPAQLSGGEQQRLAVAAAVSGSPSLLVLDEPTAELDRSSAETLLQHIVELRDSGSTFVISSHDPAVAEVADEVAELRRGRRVG